MRDSLSVEWLGATCYPVVHSQTHDAKAVTPAPALFDERGASNPAQAVRTGPLFAERRVFTVTTLDAQAGETRYLQYGQTVRLLNVYSHLYLSSKDSNGEVDVVLEHPRDVKDLVDETGVRRDLWKLLPRHKVREDGERVRRSDQLFIVNVACGLYLNLASIKSPALEAFSGMNNAVLAERGLPPSSRMLAGFQGTDSRGAAWIVSSYENYGPDAVIPPKNAVRCLDMIVIFHKEKEGFLKVSYDQHESEIGANVWLDLCKVDKSTYNVLDLEYSTNSLFIVEGEDSTQGGGAEYKKRRYRLKHLTTQRYLAVLIEKGEHGKSSTSVTTVPNAGDPNTLVTFQPLDNDNEESCVTRQGFSRIQFVHSQLWLHGTHSLTSSGVPRSATSTAHGVGEVDAVSKGYFEDVFAIRVVKATVRADLLSFISPANVLQGFISHWSTKRVVAAESEDWRGRKRVVEINSQEIAQGERLAAETSAYLHRLIRAISNVSANAELDVLEDVLPRPSHQAQRILFEQGVDTLIFGILQTPLEKGGQSLDDISKQAGVMLTIYKLGFRLVEQMIRGSKDLGVRLAKYIPFLETQLKHELNIASALMQIVSDNKQILLSLNQRQLESFCFLVPQYGRNPTYLTLLSACCVCEGEAVASNQEDIGLCLSGLASDSQKETSTTADGIVTQTAASTAKLKSCNINSLRVFYPIVAHPIDGLHIKPYNTFPPSTERKVRRFLSRYEADQKARSQGLLCDDSNVSSSESSLSSADSDGDEEMLLDDGFDSSTADTEVAIMEGLLGTHDDFVSPSHQSIRSFLYREKRPSAASWASYVAIQSQSAVQASSGAWVWKCEIPAVAPRWRRQWFSLTSGYVTFRREKRGAVLRSVPIVEISLVYKDRVAEHNPPVGVRNFGLVCEYHPLKESGTVRKLLICAECIGERNELLQALRTEVRNAENAIEGTKALSGDPVFASRVGGHDKKTTSLLGHMKSLLRKQNAARGDTEEEAEDKVTRVAIGSRFDTQWQSMANFIKHRSLQNVHYLEAQLTLCGRVCHGGNKAPLKWVQGFMTREVIREGLILTVDHPLAPLIRAAFAELAITVYLEPAADSADQAATQKHRDFLDQLKSVVDEHLRRAAPKKSGQKGDIHALHEQKFTAAVLRMCNQLIAAASYSTAELTTMLPPLLRTLARHAPQQTNTSEEATNEIMGILQPRQQTRVHTYTARERTETTSDTQMRIMETKLQACNVLMRLFADRNTYRLMSTVFTSAMQTDDIDQLTEALLATLLHTGHDLLYVTATRLLFRNLSSCVGDACEDDPEAHTRLARILQKKLDEGSPEHLLALFRLIDGAVNDELWEKSTETTLAVMKTLTRMVYLAQGNAARMKKVQSDIDRLGLAPLVAVMIEAKDERIVFHSLTLMIALMHGGNAEVQESLSQYFLSRNDEALFVTLRNRIASAVCHIKESGEGKPEARLASFTETNLHHIREVLRVLQLFAEGHNIDMQDYLRVQSDNVVSYNLVKESFSFLCVLLTMEQHNSFTQSIIVQAFDSLTEYSQGPCKGNQVQLIKGNIASQVTGALSRSFDGLTPMEINEIRSAAILCLHAVLEGVTHTDPLSAIVQQTTDIKVVRKCIGEAWANKKDESSLEVAFHMFILLKMLKMVHMVSDIPGFTFLDTMTGAIEICREGRLERVFFRIPSISANLSSETKEDLMRSVDRTTPTARISDFYYRAEGLIFEIEYYQKIFHEKRSGRLDDLLRLLQQLLHNHNGKWHNTMIFTAFVANIILAYSAVYAPPVGIHASKEWSDEVITVPTNFAVLLHTLATVQLIVTVCLMSDFLLSKAPLIAFRDDKKMRMDATRKANQRLSNTQMTAWWDSQDSHLPNVEPPTNTKTMTSGANGSALNMTESAQQQKASSSQPATAASGAFLQSNDNGADISRVLSEERYGPTAMLWRFKADVRLLFLVACLVCAVLAASGTHLCLAFHLLTVTGRSPVLVNVITAVTRHSRALILTALLGSVVVYLFTVMAFVLFREKFNTDDSDDVACDDLRGCFHYLLVNAVRAGGGVGDLILDHSWYDRPYMLFGLLSDFLFFVIIIVILLNIISGVIIDTFARLREERQVVEDDIRSRCFICGIESTQFDRQGDGFDAHIKNDHNLWFYVYFLHHLMKKDVAEFTGQESYVYQMIQEQDLAYFPLNKAIVLEGKREEEDRLLYIAREDRNVQERLLGIESRLSHVCHFSFSFKQ